MLFTKDCSKAVEDKDTINKALDVLTPQQRAVVESFYLDEKPIAEIAKEQSIPMRTVERLMQQSRNRLRAFGQSIQ